MAGGRNKRIKMIYQAREGGRRSLHHHDGSHQINYSSRGNLDGFFREGSKSNIAPASSFKDADVKLNSSKQFNNLRVHERVKVQ